jgi:hypothetical protein
LLVALLAKSSPLYMQASLTYVGGGPERLSPSYIIQQSRILGSATRRYLAAIKELARVRKLQG